MANLMKFLGSIKRKMSFGTFAEPTVPGPVVDDLQRVWDGYPTSGCGAIDPSILDDTNTKWVDPLTGDDVANPGIRSLPYRTINYAILNAIPPIIYIAIKGNFRERVSFGKPTDPIGAFPSIVGWPGETPILSVPDSHTMEEGQTSWDYPTPPLPYDVGWTLQFGPGYRGDYHDYGTYLRYFLPNSLWTNTDPGTGWECYHWLVMDGRNFTQSLGMPWLPDFYVTYQVQNAVTSLFNMVSFYGLPYGFRAIHGTPASYCCYRADIGILSDARYNALDNSDAWGNFWNTFIMPQVPGCFAGSTHPLGVDYSGFVIGICRSYKQGRFFAITTNFTVDMANKPDYSSERIIVYYWDNNLGWTWYDEWSPTYRSMFFADIAPWIDININFRFITFISANDKLYFNQPEMGGPSGNDGRSFTGNGDLKVSVGDAPFVDMDVDGNKNIDDICYYKNRYYCTCLGNLYVSDEGINNWILLFSYDQYYLNRLSPINGGLYISSFGSLKKIFFTYDGIIFKEETANPVVNRLSTPGGLVFRSNGRVCITDCKQDVTWGACPPPTPVSPLRPYPMIHFQDTIMNFETFSPFVFQNVDNIYFDGNDSSGNIACGGELSFGGGG